MKRVCSALMKSLGGGMLTAYDVAPFAPLRLVNGERNGECQVYVTVSQQRRRIFCVKLLFATCHGLSKAPSMNWISEVRRKLEEKYTWNNSINAAVACTGGLSISSALAKQPRAVFKFILDTLANVHPFFMAGTSRPFPPCRVVSSSKDTKCRIMFSLSEQSIF